MGRIIWTAFLAALLPIIAVAQDKPAYPNYYTALTNDFADVLSDEAEERINAELLTARDTRDLEMTVVTIDSRQDFAPSPNIEAFATRLFNGWGIGNPERNDGILLLVAIEDREVRIALGAGYPARQDGVATRIIQTEIVPAFREGRIADGILAGTRASLSRLEALSSSGATGQNSPTPQSDQPPIPQRTSPLDRLGQMFDQLADKASDNPILALIVGAIASVAGFFGIRLGSQWRPRKCPECNRIMLRLGDAQEDQYLDHGQLVEERINSKDYGVWFCPHDEHITVKGFRRLFSKHKACPNCGYHTYETRRKVLTHATTSSVGLAQLDHSCRNCGHRATERVPIPMVRDDSSGGGSSGFGSSSGSSFGGGSSSGGGGSGSW